VISWNVNGFKDADMDLLQPWQQGELVRDSIIFMCETRRRGDLSKWFPQHLLFQQPAPPGVGTVRKGFRLLLAVPKCVHYHPYEVLNHHDALAVELRGADDTVHALVVGMYVPPHSSPKLADVPLAERFQRLRELLSHYDSVPKVVVGDFNCDPQKNPMPSRYQHHVEALNTLQSLSMVLCTGAHDIDLDFDATGVVPHTFQSHNGKSRIDHVLACPHALQRKLTTCVIKMPINVSDHVPLLASFSLLHFQAHSRPLPRLIALARTVGCGARLCNNPLCIGFTVEIRSGIPVLVAFGMM